jgi:pimeloyl-ACP methyl ester carboxylesterase
MINGINADPQNHSGWQYLAERWILRRTEDRADTYSYGVRTTTRWLFQKKHVREAARCLIDATNPDTPVVLVGHSNGAAVVCAMLAEIPERRIEEVHLIAGAVDEDYEHNGLNAAVKRGQVGRIVVYCSEVDEALKWAGVSQKVLGWTRNVNRRWGWFPALGYQTLGLRGPKNMSFEAERATLQVWRPFAHSAWFHVNFFDTLMMDYITATAPKAPMTSVLVPPEAAPAVVAAAQAVAGEVRTA